MATSTHQDPSWADFDTLRHSVKGYTVDKLKQIIMGLSEECGSSLSKSGKKQDLIDRITQELDGYRSPHRPGGIDHWNRARNVFYQVRNTGSYSRGSGSGLSTLSSSSLGNHSSHGTISPAKASVNGYHPSAAAGPSSAGRYDPFSIQRRPMPPSATPSSPGKQVNTTLRFKSSPFFRLDQHVSAVIECPESSGAMDRKSQLVLFTLTRDHLEKLSQSSPTYQLRLFCTSSMFYTTSPTGFRSNNLPCPIEFPATCEVRVNNVLLSANLKGVKKKPGTAPPPDLGKAVRMGSTSQNRLEMVYVNSQQPISPKKFYLVVCLVEVTSVEQLVERLKKGKYRSIEEMKSRMVKSASEDDDIIAGNQTMSLKCPLSYIRITVPCRSDKCTHTQCFDATIFYSVMEQTTTWQCPVCEKILNTEDLIIDGYFDDILRHTPESVEEVIVEPNGEWHTADKKYGSANWKAAQAASNGTGQSQASRNGRPSGSGSQSHSPVAKSELTSAKGKGSANGLPLHNGDEIVIIDSDDEDEGRVKRELSPSYATHVNGKKGSSSSSQASSSHAQSSTAKKSSLIIDLTEDSDPDEARRPRPEKRKAVDAQVSLGEPSSKRPRADTIPSTLSGKGAIGYINGGPSSSSASSSHLAQPPPPPPPPPPSARPLPSPPRAVLTGHHAVPPSAVGHRGIPPPPSYASGPFPYSAYSVPSLPHRPGSYDPTRTSDPRHIHSGQYNPYLPRINGSGPAGWP